MSRAIGRSRPQGGRRRHDTGSGGPAWPVVIALALVLAPDGAHAQFCERRPIDRSICPTDVPAPEALDPVFLVGSASGNGYYDDCGFIDQLVACGWPREKIHAVYRDADPEDIATGARAMFEEIEAVRRALGAERIDLVGYSIGGPRIWAYLTLMDGARHAREVVLWGSPNYGMTFTPFIPVLGLTVTLPWHVDISANSAFNACIQGRSDEPGCANPFDEFPPMGITAAEAAAGADGIVYYNLYSDDQPCDTCLCDVWCDAPGVDQRLAHPDSDLVIVGASARIPQAYNIDVELVAHWDFIKQHPRDYTTALAWLARHRRERPPVNDVWAHTMAGLLGRDPADTLARFPRSGGSCGDRGPEVTFGLERPASAQAPVECGPALCGALAAAGATDRAGSAATFVIVFAIFFAIVHMKAHERGSRSLTRPRRTIRSNARRMRNLVLAAVALQLGGCGDGRTDQRRLDQCVLDPTCTRVLAVGHRGSTPTAPENTVAGIHAAWDAGADMVELDVRTSADGALVLMHDTTVARTTDGQGFVSDLALADLRGLDVRAPRPDKASGRVPTVAEALAAVSGRMLCLLDVKAAALEAVVEALRAAGAADACLVLVPDLFAAWAVEALDPAIAVAAWAYDWRGVADLLARSSVAAVVLADRVATPEVLAAIRRADRRAVVSLIGAPDLAAAADPAAGYGAPIDRGADLILTDFLDALAPFLERRRAPGV